MSKYLAPLLGIAATIWKIVLIALGHRITQDDAICWQLLYVSQLRENGRHR